MRNLRCLSRTQDKQASGLPCTASAWDTVNDATIFVLGPVKDNAIIELRSTPAHLNTRSESHLIASWDHQCPLPNLECDHVVSLHHLVPSETTCLVLAGGDIIIVRSAPLLDQEKIEIVGSVDSGISAAAWSPDDDLLVITTRADTLLFMTADFDNVASAAFSPEDARLSKQVSVGWGKRETQFQGKRLRALKDPTVPEYVDEGSPSAYDDGTVSISWRGDGAFVAVNTAKPPNRRMVRVFTREGSLDSVSEAVDGLEHALAWKPSGQLIAGLQRSDNDAQVVLFERNGLRHGAFSLRLTHLDQATWAKRINLAWNVDSTVLAVVYIDRVQLWSMGNYHYYLKQEIITHSAEANPLPFAISWHPEQPLRLLYNTTCQSSTLDRISLESNSSHHGDDTYSNTLSTEQLAWTLTDTPVTAPYDQGTMLVIDGRVLRLTSLRKANVPPPLASHEIELLSNAIDAAVSPRNTDIAVLHHCTVSIYSNPHAKSSRPTGEPTLRETFEIPSTADLNALQISFGSNENVYVLFCRLSSGEYCVKNLRANTSWDLPGKRFVPIHLFSSVDTHEVRALLGNEFFKVESCDSGPGTVLQPQCAYNFPGNIIAMKTSTFNQIDIAFSLTEHGALYANERLLIRNCTSYLLTPSHLIATTGKHLLKFVHLNAPVDDMVVPPDEPEADERCRNVERAARLVAAMPSIYAVVLQMPRGNLETIFPRALVLAGIRCDIDAKHYRRAFYACRSHRVDMNVLHDHEPSRFLRDIPLFIQQVDKIEHIDLFMSQLSEKDVSSTLYRNTLPESTIDKRQGHRKQVNPDRAHSITGRSENSDVQSKVNRICDAFLQALQSDYKGRLQNLITANVCKNPPDIVAGLSIISSLHDADPDRIDSAVEHICFLTDTNTIYDSALGKYDLEIALSVAQQSQKDPREYLPYLQNLQRLSDVERRFEIDNDLKRYSKALSHLQDYADDGKFLDYMEKHDLYRDALEMNKYDIGKHGSIMHAYANHLNGRNRFTEAAIAYESLNAFELASTAYTSAQMWREALSCACLADLPADTIRDLAQALADSLVESKSYQAAATILSDHLQNFPDAARTYCKGYYFSDAIRILALNGQPSRIPEIIDAGLADGFSALTELISECRSQVQAQVPRLRELREKKQRDPLAFFEGSVEAGQGEDIPDNISLAPSETSTVGGTLLTRYTGRNTGTVATGTSRRTSKNRRREERKRARGKKGSVYEEEYLVNSVGRLVERVNETGEDVQRTVEALCRRAMWERAKALQTGFSELIEGCKNCVPEVWQVDAKKATAEMDHDGPGERPLGADGVLWDSMEEARRGRTPPVVKSFTGSSLLT